MRDMVAVRPLSGRMSGSMLPRHCQGHQHGSPAKRHALVRRSTRVRAQWSPATYLYLTLFVSVPRRFVELL